MSIGTKLYTWMYGRLVGTDEVGNKYYTNGENHNDKKSSSENSISQSDDRKNDLELIEEDS